jgi:NADPH-dependent glutamate synthase beta subunit-like oxidoreductase
MPPKFSLELTEATLFTDPAAQRRTSPCEAACPAGVPIQKMNGLIQENRLEEALRFIRSRNPFSSITGRVCSRPCETGCNRNHFDEGVSIRGLERYASDHADFTGVAVARKGEATGRRIAVIGSGPAGMTCAYFSALFGHAVTVFEASSSLGGMPRCGIPEFRLPKYVVDREVGQILALGVEARTHVIVGKDVSLESLLNEYDACLIATGAWKERRLEVEGIESAISGLTLLRKANLREKRSMGKRTVVIGGGGVAFDCAFTARRLGAKEVHLLCLEGPENMCATPDDLRQAAEEGITIRHGCMVSRITGAGKTSRVEFVGITGFSFGEDGGLTVQPGPGPVNTLDADSVVVAVGFEPDFSSIDPRGRIRITQRKTIEVHPWTMATSVDRVFAAGDAVTGPGTVSQAVGSGRLAAAGIHGRLMGLQPARRMPGSGERAGIAEPHVVKYEEMLNLEEFEKKGRTPTRRLPVSKSVSSLEEVDGGFGRAEAVAEAERCFHCGHCQVCGKCVEDCPGYVLAMTDSGPKVAYPDECWHCGNCRISCPSSAVSYEFPLSVLV